MIAKKVATAEPAMDTGTSGQLSLHLDGPKTSKKKPAQRHRFTATPSDVITAIDVGTTKICTIVGRKEGKRHIRILTHSTVPCDGLRKGNVSDISATAEAIKKSLDQVRITTGYELNSAFVGVTGSHINFVNQRDELELKMDSGVITSDELAQGKISQSVQNKSPDQTLIHAISRGYTLDGVDGIRNPVGMHSRQIEVDTHVVSGSVSMISKLEKAVDTAGLSINKLVLEPLASGLAVMSAHEREEGALLIDIGGGTTDLVGFRGGRVCFTGVIPVGGFQFTNDIALTFNTSYRAAEDAKIKYATTENRSVVSGEPEITLPITGSDSKLRLQPSDISQLTRERANELGQLIRIQLDEFDVDERVRSQVVLTGGASNIPGLVGLMRQNLSVPVRQGIPLIEGTLPPEIENPIYATGVGILIWAIHDNISPEIQVNTSGIGQQRSSLLARFSNHLAKLNAWKIFRTTNKGRQ